jgi:lipoyl(octanoyl) transferase
VLPDTLLLLHHPPVITLGRGASKKNVLVDSGALAQTGVELFETDRGGDVTYHGPGQLVGYPIFLLSPDRQDVRRYVRNLEEVILSSLTHFGLSVTRIPEWTGVWLGSKEKGDARKIAAIGVHFSRWLSTHGFALNVTTDLTRFKLIVPCGIVEASVTSLAQELGREVALEEIQQAVVGGFCSVFGYAPPQLERPTMKTVSVAVFRKSDQGPQVLLLHRTPQRGGFWQIVTGRLEPGENPAAAACREVQEETGQSLAITDLSYQHAFVWGRSLPPVFTQETAFAAEWPLAGPEVRLDPKEHDDHQWLPMAEAMEKMPFVGLRQTIAKGAGLGLGRF